jgi:hypothetical protein
MTDPARIPEHGRDAAELLADIEARHAEDIDWRGGRAFSLVYNVDDHEHEELIEQVGVRYLHDNALNPFKYPSVLQMELDVIAMAADLLGTAPNAGAVSSGRHREHLPGGAGGPRPRPEDPGHRRAATAHPVHRPPGVRQGGQVPRRRARAGAGGRRRPGRRGGHRGRHHRPHRARGGLGPLLPVRRHRPDRELAGLASSGGSCSTPTPASVAGSSRGGSASGETCRRGTSGCPG